MVFRSQLPPDVKAKYNQYAFLFFLVFLTHILDVRLRLSGGSFGLVHPIAFLYFVFIPLAAGFGAMKDVPNKWYVIYFLSFFSYIIPFANYASKYLQTIWPPLIGIIGTVIMFAPLWILYLFYVGGSPLTQRLGAIYLSVWIVILFFSYWQPIRLAAESIQLDVPGIQPGFTIEQLLSKFLTGLRDFWTSLTKGVGGAQERFKQQLELAAYGDVYTGRVEEQQKKRIGVFLGSLQGTETTFLQGKPMTVYAKLKAETIEKPITIKIFCGCCTTFDEASWRCGPNPEDGTACEIKPRNPIVVQQFEDREIDCKFPVPAAGTNYPTAKEGAKTITMKAQFNFLTNSFLRTYLMDAERVRVFRREGIDPLDQYGIREKSPVAVFTPGPINIGIGVSEAPLPISVDRNEPEKVVTLGITIQNRWEGKIANITNLTIIVPQGFVIEDVNAFDLPQSYCHDEVGGTGKACDIPIDRVISIPEGGIKAGVQLRVHMEIPAREYPRVLGTDPIAVRFFKVSLEYTYEIERMITVMVGPEQT